MLAITALQPERAGAFAVSPMRSSMETLGPRAVNTVRVENTQENRLAIEIEVFRREIAPDGSETLIPDEEDLLIFPPQAIVEPGGRQAFRMQWLGEPELERGRSYRVMVVQLPLDLETPEVDGGQVNLLFRFSTIVDVNPPGGRAEPRVAALSPGERAGEPGVEVELVNDGARMLYLGETTMDLTYGPEAGGEARTRRYGPGELAGLFEGGSALPPGGLRRFFLPLAEAAGSAGLALEVDF